ncbi:MAG: chloride channel protein [Anaerolineales bacterium]|nr:chloride channel protein [Anaerolineales bacterium]
MVQKITAWFDWVMSSQTLTLGGSAILVGLASGAGVWLFKWLIDFVHGLMFGGLYGVVSPLGAWMIALIPAVGGVIVGLINHYLLGEEKVHGTAGIMQSVALAGGRLHYQDIPLKSVAAVISIGAGASVGPEDPSVQIGANIGSMLAQTLRMSDDRIRTLVAAGAASAIAAAFNAPIAGVFFALELVLGEIGSNALGMILVAAVTSSVFTQAVSGSSPAFQIPQYAFHSAWEFPLYLALGLLAGPVSALYVRLLYTAQDFYNGWMIPRWMKTASAGLIVGVAGIFLPQVFGVGYETIGEILNKNDLTLWLLFALLIAKIILTPISMGGGFFGGVFAPSLFIGATLGGGFGIIAATLFPSLNVNPSAFALVGMAAVLAGSVHAPLTAVILLFELTSDYRIILPLMFAVAVSLLISQRIQKDSIYALGLARHGIRLDRGRDVEVMQTIMVGESMQLDTSVLLESATLSDAAETLMQTRHHGLPVVDEKGLLVGILTVEDIERAGDKTFVSEACTRAVETAFPDETLNIALRRMSRRDVGRLPVVARENPQKLLGVLRRADMVRAYDIALTRRTAQRHHEQTVRLDALTPARVDVSDVVIENRAQCVGKRMSEIPFPHDSVIASVRRGRQVFIPRGETELRAGDILVVVADGEALAGVLRLCKKSSKSSNA